MWLTNLKLLVSDLVLVNVLDYHWGCSAIYLVHSDGAEVSFALFIHRISILSYIGDFDL